MAIRLAVVLTIPRLTGGTGSAWHCAALVAGAPGCDALCPHRQHRGVRRSAPRRSVRLSSFDMHRPREEVE